MKRRAFLGFLGGAAVAGPSVAKTAAQMTVADLSVGSHGAQFASGYAVTGGNPSSQSSWAKEALKKMAGKSAQQIAYERRKYQIGHLDSGVASLRSVALRHKIQMTKNIAYERDQDMEKTWLQGQIKGWFS